MFSSNKLILSLSFETVGNKFRALSATKLNEAHHGGEDVGKCLVLVVASKDILSF